MEHLLGRRSLWLLSVGTVLLLAVLLVGMSLASAQTATPGVTASPGTTAAPMTTAATTPGGTVAPSTTASPLATAGVTSLATQAVTSTTTTTTTLTLTLPQRPYLPLNAALAAANGALSKCTLGGYKVTVTVVDAAGVQRVVLSQDGANPATPSASYRKAFTAASLGSPTSALAERIAADPTQAGIARLDDRILALGGGLPISANNQVVGGIGVAGAPAGAIDETCARAGLDSLR